MGKTYTQNPSALKSFAKNRFFIAKKLIINVTTTVVLTPKLTARRFSACLTMPIPVKKNDSNLFQQLLLKRGNFNQSIQRHFLIFYFIISNANFSR